jgi:hypothetical protein
MSIKRSPANSFRGALLVLAVSVGTISGFSACQARNPGETPGAGGSGVGGGPNGTGGGGDIAFDPSKVGRCCRKPSTDAWTVVNVHGVNRLRCLPATQCT